MSEIEFHDHTATEIREIGPLDPTRPSFLLRIERNDSGEPGPIIEWNGASILTVMAMLTLTAAHFSDLAGQTQVAHNFAQMARQFEQMARHAGEW